MKIRYTKPYALCYVACIDPRGVLSVMNIDEELKGCSELF